MRNPRKMGWKRLEDAFLEMDQENLSSEVVSIAEIHDPVSSHMDSYGMMHGIKPRYICGKTKVSKDFPVILRDGKFYSQGAGHSTDRILCSKGCHIENGKRILGEKKLAECTSQEEAYFGVLDFVPVKASPGHVSPYPDEKGYFRSVKSDSGDLETLASLHARIPSIAQDEYGFLNEAQSIDYHQYLPIIEMGELCRGETKELVYVSASTKTKEGIEEIVFGTQACLDTNTGKRYLSASYGQYRWGDHKVVQMNGEMMYRTLIRY